ncbi:hypothetical protein B0H34DRAFT_730875 [Crassisporium funariophilum]|nr:hypothetical protein B0H34DRAFT_730875 [Crassisporium funariophilum]
MMRSRLRALALIILGQGFIWAQAGQIPYQTQWNNTVTGSPPENLHIDNTWDFGTRPSSNSTSHLIFSTANSLLQHWQNTRYRNGHTIVPGTIPPGTLLYHGTTKKEIPQIAEWTATDPEHSYIFCRNLKTDEGCWHLTLVTTRALKVLYFDGSSAAKMQDGAMDSQDILAWGRVVPEWTYKERKRIDDLCEWGKQFELDGFVRMEMDLDFVVRHVPGCDSTLYHSAKRCTPPVL